MKKKMEGLSKRVVLYKLSLLVLGNRLKLTWTSKKDSNLYMSKFLSYKILIQTQNPEITRSMIG